MLFSEFKKKEVINLKNCQKLGKVCDFEFDECTGQIFKLIVPGENKWCGLFGGNDSNYVICYKDIKQIGPDIIIVDICRKSQILFEFDKKFLNRFWTILQL